MPFSDVLDREAAWLNTVGDGLPALLAVFAEGSQANTGGPFGVVQARTPNVRTGSKRLLYVLRNPSTESYKVTHYASIRSRPSTSILLRVVWPLSNSAAASTLGMAEASSLEFERAIDLVVARVLGPAMDKSHGGRFLSAAQGAGVSVMVNDPDVELDKGSAGVFRAAITYTVDDPELIN